METPIARVRFIARTRCAPSQSALLLATGSLAGPRDADAGWQGRLDAAVGALQADLEATRTGAQTAKAGAEAEAKTLRTPYWASVRLATETTAVTLALELLSTAAVLGVLHAKGGKALYAKGVASNLFDRFATAVLVVEFYLTDDLPRVMEPPVAVDP